MIEEVSIFNGIDPGWFVENLPDPILICDPHTVREANSHAAKLFGATHKRDLKGVSNSHLFDQATQLTLSRNRAPHPGPSEWEDCNLRRLDGSQFAAEVFIVHNGTSHGGVFLIRLRADDPELGKQRRIQQDHIGARHAEGAARQFVARISHEFRTPLNAIIGFSDIICSQLFGSINSRYAEYARDINDSARHLHGIVEEVLNYSKIEAGQTDLNEETVFLDEIIGNAVRLLSDSANGETIEIVTKCPDQLPPLSCDKVKITQTLINLIANAISFSPPNSIVEVGTCVNEYEDFCIYVADHGVGMTKEQSARAIEPFQQVHDDDQFGRMGTGLGLSISRSIMELHGGSLKIMSVPGQGTTVSLYLPSSRAVKIPGGQ